MASHHSTTVVYTSLYFFEAFLPADAAPIAGFPFGADFDFAFAFAFGGSNMVSFKAAEVMLSSNEA